MIDTHAHFNSRDIKALDIDIPRLNGSQLTKVINVGLDIETSLESLSISNRNDKFYSTNTFS